MNHTMLTGVTATLHSGRDWPCDWAWRGPDAKQWLAAASYGIGVTAIGGDCQKGAFANYRSWVDLAAPFIVGQAALLHSRFPTLSGPQVTDRIEKTAQRLSAKLGGGLPNLVASLP